MKHLLPITILIVLTACASARPRAGLPERAAVAMNALEQAGTRRPEAGSLQPEIRPPTTVPAAGGESFLFDETGVGQSLSHETRDNAVERAKEDALAKVMPRAADLFYGFVDFSAQIGGQRLESVSRHLLTSSKGVPIYEMQGEPKCGISQGVTRCEVRIKGRMEFRGNLDPAFKLLRRSGDKETGLDRIQYRDGDPVRISLASSQKAYLHVFSWDSGDKLYLVFPNRYQREGEIQGGVSATIPAEGGGLAYRAMLPKGRSSTLEKLIVLLTKKPILSESAVRMTPGQDYADFDLDRFADLMKKLADLERNEWTLEVFPYTIVSKDWRAPDGQ